MMPQDALEIWMCGRSPPTGSIQELRPQEAEADGPSELMDCNSLQVQNS